MNNIINFLRNILYKLTGRKLSEGPPETPVVYEEQSVPKHGVIEQEPVLAFENGFLVMLIDHHFPNIPSWVEWDRESATVTITQMNGDTDEASVRLKKDLIDDLAQHTKVLLVSNDNGQAIAHAVTFLTRG